MSLSESGVFVFVCLCVCVYERVCERNYACAHSLGLRGERRLSVCVVCAHECVSELARVLGFSFCG